MKQQIAEMQIENAIRVFHALENRYPRDHEEFMEQVIKGQQHSSAATGKPGKRYEYDVANHRLMVVREPAEGDE